MYRCYELKQCSACKELLDEECFTKRTEYRGKLRSQCRKCVNKRNLERYYASDKTQKRKITYKYNLKVNYGLNVEEYNKIYEEQKGVCAICSSPLENVFLGIEGTRSALDHCHMSGKNRQILCILCNTGLGVFRDNPVYLSKAKEYLEKHSL